MLLYELEFVERLEGDCFRASIRCVNQPGCGQVIEVDSGDLLDYGRFRRRVFDRLGVIFSLVPDERFHRPTTAPLGLPILPREWDAAVQQAIACSESSTSFA